MGGQATVFSSSYNNASAYDIKAAVIQHAFTHEHPAPQIPFLAMTGSSDTVADPADTEKYFNASGANPHRGLVNKKGATHMEPVGSLPARIQPTPCAIHGGMVQGLPRPDTAGIWCGL